MAAVGSTFPITADAYGGAVGILSAQIISINGYEEPGNQNSLGVASERYAVMLEPCEVVDQKIIDLTDSINTNKQLILDTDPGIAQSFVSDAAAQTALSDLYGDTRTNNYPNCQSVSFASSLSLPVSAAFTVDDVVFETGGGAYGFVAIATVSSEVYLRSVVGVFTGGSISSISGGSEVGFATDIYSIGIASIHNDVSLIRFYGDLEPADASSDNPYGNYSTPVLTTSNKGIGAGNTFFKNGIDTGDGGNRMLNALKGNVIAFDTSTYPTQEATITSAISDITTDRVGVGTYTGSANVVKNTKTGYALNVWAYTRGNKVVDDRTTSIQAAIDLLEDPDIGGPY